MSTITETTPSTPATQDQLPAYRSPTMDDFMVETKPITMDDFYPTQPKAAKTSKPRTKRYTPSSQQARWLYKAVAGLHLASKPITVTSILGGVKEQGGVINNEKARAADFLQDLRRAGEVCHSGVSGVWMWCGDTPLSV